MNVFLFFWIRLKRQVLLRSKDFNQHSAEWLPFGWIGRLHNQDLIEMYWLNEWTLDLFKFLLFILKYISIILNVTSFVFSNLHLRKVFLSWLFQRNITWDGNSTVQVCYKHFISYNKWNALLLSSSTQKRSVILWLCFLIFTLCHIHYVNWLSMNKVSTVIPEYPWRIGSRTPTDDNIRRYSRPCMKYCRTVQEAVPSHLSISKSQVGLICGCKSRHAKNRLCICLKI